MNKLSLRHQVWAGFAVMLILIAISSGTSISNLNSLNDQAKQIIDEAQPTIVDALNIRAGLNSTAKNINAYIVSQQASDKAEISSSIDQLNVYFDQFTQRPNIINDEELLTLTNEIHASFGKFKSLSNQIEHLVEKPVDNFPALKIAESGLAPLSKSILTSLNNAIISELEEENSSQRKALLYELTDLRYNWMNIISSNRSFLANPTQVSHEKMKSYIILFKKQLTSIQKRSAIFTLEQEEAVANITRYTIAHFKFLKKIYKLYTSNSWRKDQALLKNEIKPLIESISSKLNIIVSQQQDASENLSRHLLAQISNSILITLSILAFAIFAGITIGWSNTKQIRTIVIEISNSLKHLSRGEFSFKLNENRKGEVGKVAMTINEFSSQLESMITDLTQSVDRLRTASSDMSTTVSETSDNILLQHRETEMVATAVEEMTATAQEVARSASTAATSARHANDLTSSGALVSTEAMGGISHLVNDLNNASDVVQTLRDESNNISIVLDVIRDISEQTNLLALNAAIEAARAGEQGRGFAVVADEVRTLASRTQESTDNIRKKIEELQHGASNAVEVMENAIKRASENNDQVENVAESLGEIAGEIHSINGQLDQIAAASEQQSATSEEISRNVSSISDLAEKTVEGTTQAKSAEDSLSMVTQSIENVIAKFKS